jgi:hypothetical protein
MMPELQLTDEQRRQVETWQAQVRTELTQIPGRRQLMASAAREESFSGELRRAIRQGPLHPVQLARRIGLDPVELDEFLSGESVLTSEVVGKIMAELGLKLAAADTSESN